MSEERKNDDKGGINAWEVISLFGRGVAKGVQWIGNAPDNISNMLHDGVHTVRNAMSITEIVSIFNTIDKDVTLINHEAKHDNQIIPALTMKRTHTAQTDGIWVPWYDPNRTGDFKHHCLEFRSEDQPILYIWQWGHYIYWCSRLNEQGQPERAYKIGGVAEAVGRRSLVIRYDPDFGYSAFLSRVDGER